MIKSNNATYQAALNDIVCRKVEHKLSSKFIESVLVHGPGYGEYTFMCIGFQKVDDRCFVIIGRRDPLTKFSATSATDAIEGTGDWYEVTKEEGNRIYKYILKNVKYGKTGRPYYRWEMDI